MMLRTIVCLALALALAAAVEEDGLANAHDTIKLMKSQGLGADACQALAESSIQDVNSAKGTTQSFLNTLDTGATCAQRGQKEVAAAKQSLNDATNAASHAKSALDNASAVVPVITIPSVATLMGMRETCDFIYGSDAVKNANAALVTAQVTKTQADAQVVSYTTALKAAQDAASAAAKQCRCDAKSKLESEWTIASDPTNAATQKSSWDQAQNILCALNAKSPCNAPAVPTLVKPILSDDTEAQNCPDAKEQSSQELSSKEQSSKETCSKFTITACEDDNYKDNCVTKGPGEYGEKMGINDNSIGSVKVAAGGKFYGYEKKNFGGNVLVLSSNTPDLNKERRGAAVNNGRDNDWSDQISSFKVWSEC